MKDWRWVDRWFEPPTGSGAKRDDGVWLELYKVLIGRTEHEDFQVVFGWGVFMGVSVC